MDFRRIAIRVAFGFNVKMDVNAFVINEIAHLIDPSAKGADLDNLQNEVAVSIMESDIHQSIHQMADAISKEVDKLKKSKAA